VIFYFVLQTKIKKATDRFYISLPLYFFVFTYHRIAVTGIFIIRRIATVNNGFCAKIRT